jgi:hypothetical protein
MPQKLPPEILIDGFNLLHAVVLQGRERAQWWSKENQLRVLKLVASFQPSTDLGFASSDLPRLCVVFDASDASEHRLTDRPEDACPIALKYAADADDWIVSRAAELHATPPLIVSADRSLLDRARRWGAGRLSPWTFAEMCNLKR